MPLTRPTERERVAGMDKTPRPPLGFAGRLGLFYAATFFLAGIKVTYLPVWLDWRGLSAAEIGWITAAPLFLRLIATPVIAYGADRTNAHRQVLIGLAWGSVGLLALMLGAGGFWSILLLTLLLALASTTIMPLTETIAMAGVRRSGHDYGRMRLWGSLSFIVAGYIAGAGIAAFGPGALLGMLIVAAVLTGLAAHAMPVVPVAETSTGTAKETAAGPRLTRADVADLASNRPFVLFLAAVGAVQAAHAVFYTFGVLLWRDQGLSTVTISSLWAIGVVAEIVLFAYSGTVVRLIGANGLLLAGALAAVVRWALMAVDPPLWALAVLQLLHGLTFGATHLGAVHFIAAQVAPAQAGTAQALHSSVTSGIAMGLATLLAGQLYPQLGGRTYLAMSVLAAFGAIAAVILARTARRKTEIVPESE